MKNPNQKDAGARLLTSAAQLFVCQGYAQTGINQIIAESKTAKASFYQHYKSKEQLGISYLRFYYEDQMGLLSLLANKYPSPQGFLKSWVQILKRQSKMGELYGCSMANLRAQIGSHEVELKREVESIATKTMILLRKIIVVWRRNNMLKNNIDVDILARRLLLLYEGSLHTVLLTSDISGFDDFYEMALTLFLEQ